jgi:sec-independent protein translocase protein TatB
MFDIGFTELLLVSVVGLLVLGPERLPGAIRTGSLWLGQLRRSFNNIRSEIEREINAEDIKREIHNDAVMKSLKEAEKDLRAGLDSTPYNLEGIVDSEPAAESAVKETADSDPGAVEMKSSDGDTAGDAKK